MKEETKDAWRESAGFLFVVFVFFVLGTAFGVMLDEFRSKLETPAQDTQNTAHVMYSDTDGYFVFFHGQAYRLIHMNEE